MSNEKFTGTTHIGVVLDKSGSMGVVRRETIDGFNTWLRDQQSLTEDTALLTMVLFDTNYRVPVVAAPIDKVNPLDESRYSPSGSTALLDAVARTITEMEPRGATGDRFLVVIITDGQENTSKEITKEALAGMIRERQSRGNWTFTYLSAGLDAFADAAGIGIAAGNTQAYTGDSLGTEAAFLSASVGTRGLRTSASAGTKSFYEGRSHAESEPRRPQQVSAPTPPQTHPSAQTDWTKDAQPAQSSQQTSEWVRP